MSYDAFVTEDRRGAIVRFLADQNSFSLNEGVLQDALDRLGHSVSRDVVRTDLSWLEEQGLLRLTELKGLWLAVLTTRGEDAAHGRTRVPGLKVHRAPRAD